jgi:hypothetical protein
MTLTYVEALPVLEKFVGIDALLNDDLSKMGLLLLNWHVDDYYICFEINSWGRMDQSFMKFIHDQFRRYAGCVELWDELESFL